MRNENKGHRDVPNTLLDLEPLLTIYDLERLLQVHRRTVSRLCKDGKFPKPFKLGGQNRWRARDIAGMVNGSNLTESEHKGSTCRRS